RPDVVAPPNGLVERRRRAGAEELLQRRHSPRRDDAFGKIGHRERRRPHRRHAVRAHSRRVGGRGRGSRQRFRPGGAGPWEPGAGSGRGALIRVNEPTTPWPAAAKACKGSTWPVVAYCVAASMIEPELAATAAWKNWLSAAPALGNRPAGRPMTCPSTAPPAF